MLLISLLLGGCGAKQDAMGPDMQDEERSVTTLEEPTAVEPAVDEPAADRSTAGTTASEDPAQHEAARDDTSGEMTLPITAPENNAQATRSVTRSPKPVTVESFPRGARQATRAVESMADEPKEQTPRESPSATEIAPYSLPAEAMSMETESREEPPAETAAVEGPPAAAEEAKAEKPFELVTVFYATDRKVIDAATTDAAKRRGLLPPVVAACITLLLLTLSSLGFRRRLTLSLSAVGCLATLVLGGYWALNYLPSEQQMADLGVRYGNERGTLDYGTCQISIPSTHDRGEIERPSILRLEVREDVTRHVVLQAIKATSEDEFFVQLRDKVESAERSEVFVFVHGYNVTFDGAARRTAQIAYDVKFAGAPIFFSWPSQGGLLKYTVDENNVEWSVSHLKQFLLDVTRRSGAKSVNLIAHSMGNRALTAALRELRLQLGQETTLFNQVILAAPDIDAEIFKRDLAPALTRSARRVTLYASSNDQALVASKKVHGYPRAGESGPDLVVLPGVETIDVSTLDTSLLGHSYYGSSDPILLDIGQLIHDALPASERPFLLPRPYGQLTYWVFEKIRATANREHPSDRTQ